MPPSHLRRRHTRRQASSNIIPEITLTIIRQAETQHLQERYPHIMEQYMAILMPPWSIDSVPFLAPVRCPWFIWATQARIDMYHFRHLRHYHKECRLPDHRPNIEQMCIKDKVH